MYINDRDQINHHGFLKALREYQGAGLRHVAEGICSDSEVFRVEIGDRLPEKLMRDRIIGRLGISGEEYEEYLRPEEYRQWEIRMHILEHLNKGNPQEVDKGLQEYKKIPDKNPVQKQFFETMIYMYWQMMGVAPEILAMQIELAIVHTIPDVDAAFKGLHLLADQELNLILEFTGYRTYPGAVEEEFEWRKSKYQAILDYVDRSNMDTLAKSKVYPRASLYLCRWILEKGADKENLEYALDICTKSIELLRDASRLYYFIELLECRRNIVEALLKDTDETEELECIASKDLAWIQVLKDLYKEFDRDVYMKNFTYLYAETECYSVVEVIRTRRNMLKLSRLKVSDNICSEKTVERFENYITSPTIVIIRDLFERMHLCAEYKRARIITDDVELMNTFTELTNHMISWDSEKSMECIARLEEKLHMDISYNKQTLGRIKNLLLIRNKNGTEEDRYKNVLDTLELTIPFGHLIREQDIYLSRTEWYCIYDLAFRVQGQVSMHCIELIKKWCLDKIDKSINVSEMSMFEILLGELASYYGNIGMYEESDAFSRKILKECLEHRRQTFLSGNIYNMLWNYESQKKADNSAVDIEYIINRLDTCVLLSDIDRETGWQTFFQNKLSTYE